MKNTKRYLFALLVVFSLIAAGCGDDEGEEDAVTEPPTAEEGDDALAGDAGDADDETVTTPEVGDDEAAVGDDEAAAGEAQQFVATLQPLNDSGASGRATIERVGNNQVKVTVTTEGVSPTLPHAQHIHIGGNHECPKPTAAGDDNLISTAEGRPAYGPVKVSLTTEGDVGEMSALAIPRFPVASDDGRVTYSRTFDLPQGTTFDDVSKGVVVQHGISKLFGDPLKYDGEPRSSLDPSLPLEATIPTLCGVFTPAGP